MSDHDQPTPVDDRTPAASRRTVLRRAGFVALAGGGAAVLAACSADAGTADTPATSAPAASESSSAASSTPSAETSSAAPSPTAKATKKAAEKAPSGPSIATSKVPVGGGVILDDADFVVTQPTKGTFKAFSKICTHRQCPVTEVTGRNIVCKCHGSTFSIKDGSVTNPPAGKPLAESDVEVFKGKAYVTG